jgi:hypothetical protein
MLPLFNISSRYLTDKISSSVLASLATGAPLVVPRRFLEVYTPFREEHVVLLVRAPGGRRGAVCGEQWVGALLHECQPHNGSIGMQGIVEGCTHTWNSLLLSVA